MDYHVLKQRDESHELSTVIQYLHELLHIL